MTCSCTVRGKPIEYDASSAGTNVACPHCGQTTKLAIYAAAPPPLIQQPHFIVQPSPQRSNAWIVILVVVIGLIVIIPIIGLLAVIAIPNFVKARHASQRAACVANLKSIDSAKAAWALENRKTDIDTPTDAELFSGKYMSVRPACPANGSYTVGTVGEKPTCTISDHAF